MSLRSCITCSATEAEHRKCMKEVGHPRWKQKLAPVLVPAPKAAPVQASKPVRVVK